MMKTKCTACGREGLLLMDKPKKTYDEQILCSKCYIKDIENRLGVDLDKLH